MGVPLLAAERRWECGACDAVHVTRIAAPHAPMHQCKGMRGLLVPYVPAGTRCKVEAREREDYVNGEHVTLDGNGRPVMSVITTRDDGQDCTVYAPAARARMET